MEAVVAKFDRLRVSKGYLLTVKDNARKIRDAFFHGKPIFYKWQTYSVIFAKFPIIICTVERCQVDPRNPEL